ncbi:MAG: hypothetical protein E7330_05100 [Clostridiales bacterium]|nr:hypothetical protein [Clostridiales bacterium]
MYYSPVPLLVLRADVPALMEVNGQPAGECLPDGHIALPLSDSGDYYIGLSPLSDAANARLYGITRKVGFKNGQIAVYPAPDVEVCAWPGGVFELLLRAGRLQRESTPHIPYRIDRIEPRFSGSVFALTLYYENGIRLCVEEGGETRGIYSLGDGETGSLNVKEVGNAQYVAVNVKSDSGERLILLDGAMETVFEAAAGTITIENGAVCCIDPCGTLLGHERRTVYARQGDGTFLAGPPETGFFTCPPRKSANSFERAVSFLEAVREGFEAEALSCLTDGLREGLRFSALRDFFGSFTEVRPPLSDKSGRFLGTVTKKTENRSAARLYEFTFAEDGRIDNITEQ